MRSTPSFRSWLRRTGIFAFATACGALTAPVSAGEPIVFLGWEPHPMNANFSLKYLTGGEEFFGEEGVVNTVTRVGYAAECPNTGALLKNMTFTLPMENEIMGAILDDGEEAADAPDRHAALVAALDDLYVPRAAAHSGLPQETVRGILGLDIELNAQGLGVWLDSRQTSAAGG